MNTEKIAEVATSIKDKVTAFYASHPTTAIVIVAVVATFVVSKFVL